MRVITITRRPCGSSVAESCLAHGTGGYHIDACRVATRDNLNGGAYAEQGTQRYDGAGGRWPANLMVQHQPGCKRTGTHMLPGYLINRWTDGAKPFGGGAGHEYESEKVPDEQVAIYECVPECPVPKLSPSGEDASRFFQHVMATMSNSLPQDLWDYLTTLVSPPEQYLPNVLKVQDPSEVPWENLDQESVHGVIWLGDPTEHLDHLYRVMKPGAHLLIVSDSDVPNFEAIVRVEGYGYEVRDAICYLDSDTDKFRYTAKASSAERNAGLASHCTHPTVKPIAMMRHLLEDIPQGALVCDPFLGSGTTGIACLQDGYDFVGIDREDEYVAIAHNRILHWAAEQSKKAAKPDVLIESEGGEVPKLPTLEDDLNSLFGSC